MQEDELAVIRSLKDEMAVTQKTERRNGCYTKD